MKDHKTEMAERRARQKALKPGVLVRNEMRSSAPRRSLALPRDRNKYTGAMLREIRARQFNIKGELQR